MPVARVSALPHPALGIAPTTSGFPLSGPASPMGMMAIVPLLAMAPLETVPLLATVPLLTAPLLTLPLLAPVPLLTTPLVAPERLPEAVPELAPLIAPAVVPLLMPEPATDPSLVRPPHAAMTKSTNATGDHRPWLGDDRAVMAAWDSRTEASA
jgi:hypothetical protein